MEPLDLTVRPPRSCYVELDGLMLLPRTIDKLRAALPGGNVGVYFPVNGPMLGLSGYLLHRLGIDEDELRDSVARASDETEVAGWLRSRTDPEQYPAINATLRQIRPKHAEKPDLFAEIYRETLAARPDLEYIIDILDADDARMFGRLA